MNTSIMNNIDLNRYNWTTIEREMDREGYALLPNLLTEKHINDLHVAAEEGGWTQLSEVDRGQGKFKLLGEIHQILIASMRSEMYSMLIGTANRWQDHANVNYRFPARFEQFTTDNYEAGRRIPDTAFTSLQEGDYLALNQQQDALLNFPMQLEILLSKPDEDFSGGEFVMTEQRPRMQSRPMVLPLQYGDAALIATSRRPFKGATGIYTVNSKHAISRVKAGARLGLSISFNGVHYG